MLHADKPAAAITSIGAYLPDRVVTNHDLARRLDTSDEWIRTRTGIRERRIADEAQSTGDMAVAACKHALSGFDRSAIGMLLLATTTPDFRCPATAPIVADRLDLDRVPAFDISAVCCGFIYALSTACAYIESGFYENILVVAAEKFSDIIDQNDRTTACLFGDGAAAVVVSKADKGYPGVIQAVDLHSDGSLADSIMAEVGGSRYPTAEDAGDGASSYLRLRGQEVFSAAVQKMAQSVSAVAARLGWLDRDIDYLIGHQANGRILHALGRQLNLDPQKIVVHLDRCGNTAAASIPLAMAEEKGRIPPGSRVVLVAFGAGATWGSAALTWPEWPEFVN